MEMSFGAFDAKNRFSELLDLVSQGKEIVITRHGQEVARLVPVQESSRTQARAAVESWRQARQTVRLNDDGKAPLTIRDLIDEGRR